MTNKMQKHLPDCNVNLDDESDYILGDYQHCTCKNVLTDEQLDYRFDLYGALWLLCSRWHNGQNSRGYRILSRLRKAQYVPSPTIQNNRFESERMKELYAHYWKFRYTL